MVLARLYPILNPGQTQWGTIKKYNASCKIRETYVQFAIENTVTSFYLCLINWQKVFVLQITDSWK